MPKWILYSGIAIVLFFLILAIFAPLIAPYGFAQSSSGGVDFPKQAPPSGAHLFGTTVQSTDVLSRVIWGARTEIEVVVAGGLLLARDRRAARPHLRLRRRQARPRPGPDHGRAVRLPLPAARDRDRVPALGQDRPGDHHRRGRDHDRLHTPVLPRGPKPRDQRPRGAVRRGGAGARAPSAGRSSAATCSST